MTENTAENKNIEKKKVVIVGSGFGALGMACLLSKKGHDVTVYEKNEQVGGKASLYTENGYTFDMGPSWYMMPDIFEDFFKLLGEDVNQHLKLKRLAPSYRIFLKSEKKHYDFYSDMEKNKATFESIEPGSAPRLEKYLAESEYMYKVAIKEFMYKNYNSVFDFFNKRILTEGRKLPIFAKMGKIAEKYFKKELLQKVLQYQTVLLGTSPFDTPGIYRIMNHVDFNLGVWYPDGGIYELVKALKNIAEKHGTKFIVNAPVDKIIVEDGVAKGIELESGEVILADIVVSNADRQHTDSMLLDKEYREYSPRYWKSRLLAPSAYIMYLGINKKVPELTHHNLLFSKDWRKNFHQIFKKPTWPEDPSLYVCAPSVSDDNVAPVGKENVFVLVPLASGLEGTADERREFGNKVIDIMDEYMAPGIKSHIEYRKDFSVKEFRERYNAFNGSALGLAHNLLQTAIFRPNNINKKVKNLYYVGADTNPGIGMPVCLISAELAYKRIYNITDPEPLSKI